MPQLFPCSFCFALLLPFCSQAQVSGLPAHSPAYHLLDRLDILGGTESPLHPELKQSSRRDAAEYALACLGDSSRGRQSARQPFSRLDRADLQYLLDDNNEWVPDSLSRRSVKPFLRTFYKTPANLFEVNTPDFTLRANPMFNFAFGRQGSDAELLFQNQRGLEVRGAVDEKVFFYTNLVETQARYADYVNDWESEFRALPGAGVYKTYTPRFAQLSRAYDFQVANAHIGLNVTRHVGLELGHGRHFIGNGYRSLLLSDVGAPTFYLKLNTRVWRFQYQNLFLELSPSNPNAFSNVSARVPRKYVAIHYLNYKITPRMAVGLFEATVFNRSQQFEFQYLNPVILYRTVEASIGSADNVLIGLDGRWNLFRRVQLYGQLLLDEFFLKEIVAPERSGWWGNKYGIQAGLKYVNAFGIEHLDLQAELNLARPYTWSHTDSLNSYTHYRQPLAHPLWSNFREIVGIARYSPTARWLLTARLVQARTGDNRPGENWGSFPVLSNQSRVQDYGNAIGQGAGARLLLLGLDASWRWRHNLFVDVKCLLRTKDSDDPGRDATTRMASVGLRMNLWENGVDF